MKRPDHKRILNDTVWNAAAIMEDKIDEWELILEMFKAKPADEHNQNTINSLSNNITRTRAAIEIMDENGGCWS